MNVKFWKRSSPFQGGQNTLSSLLQNRSVGLPRRFNTLEMIPLLGSPFAEGQFEGPWQNLLWSSNPQAAFVKNRSSRTIIVPLHSGRVQAKEGGQIVSHTMVLEPGGQMGIDNAATITPPKACWDVYDESDWISLPFPLRQAAFRLRNVRGHTKLWPHIERLKLKAGLTRGSLPTEISQELRTKMDQVEQAFSVVSGQTGAIFLLDGILVGIELAPDAAYWEALHRLLIRFAYAPLAMMDTQAESKTTSILTEDDFLSKKQQAEEQEAQSTIAIQNAKRRVSEFGQQSLEAQPEGLRAFNQVMRVQVENMNGQAVVHSGQAAYLSISHQKVGQI